MCYELSHDDITGSSVNQFSTSSPTNFFCSDIYCKLFYNVNCSKSKQNAPDISLLILDAFWKHPLYAKQLMQNNLLTRVFNVIWTLIAAVQGKSDSKLLW